MAYDPDLADRIREVVAAEPALDEKRMFGGLAFLLDGRLAVAAGQEGLMVRVDPSRTDELVARPGAERMVMRGRAMDGWLRVSSAVLDDDAALRGWVGEGVAYVRALPPR